eukprot:7716660-Prorocentrum_lima.AAC.1
MSRGSICDALGPLGASLGRATPPWCEGRILVHRTGRTVRYAPPGTAGSTANSIHEALLKP